MHVKIYQVHTDAGKRMEDFGAFVGTLFNDERCLLKKDNSLPRSKYDMVYECDRPDGTDLEDLFFEFNCEHPEDYRTHSMSVSDVVDLDGKLYFCDSIGFKPAHWED